MDKMVVGVAGLGLLGRGIAACLLAHGIQVVAYDISPADRSAANIAIANDIDELIEHGYCDPSIETTWGEQYIEAKSVEELAHCHFLIEPATGRPRLRLTGALRSTGSHPLANDANRQQYFGTPYHAAAERPQVPSALPRYALGRARPCDTLSRNHSR